MYEIELRDCGIFTMHKMQNISTSHILMGNKIWHCFLFSFLVCSISLLQYQGAFSGHVLFDLLRVYCGLSLVLCVCVILGHFCHTLLNIHITYCYLTVCQIQDCRKYQVASILHPTHTTSIIQIHSISLHHSNCISKQFLFFCVILFILFPYTAIIQ